MTPAGGAAEPGSAHSNHKAVLDTVRAWSRAWAEQRVADYLAFYSPGFELAAGIGRSAWQETRRDRLIRPQYIDIALDEIQIRFEARNQARVEFVQSYRSDRFADRVRKTLQLVLESAGWRILRETVEEVL